MSKLIPLTLMSMFLMMLPACIGEKRAAASASTSSADSAATAGSPLSVPDAKCGDVVCL